MFAWVLDAPKPSLIGLNLHGSRYSKEKIKSATHRSSLAFFDEIQSSWLYNDQAVSLLQSYVKAFPEVLDCLKNQMAGGVLGEYCDIPLEVCSRIGKTLNSPIPKPEAIFQFGTLVHESLS